MGYPRIAIFWLLAPGVLCTWGQQSQRPPAPATPLSDVQVVDPEKQADRPLTADEERERAIRRYDPLNRDDPSARGDQKREGTSQPQQRAMPAPRPLPGSVAASSQQGFLDPRVQGPKVVDGSGPENVAQDYTGPAVLSRSYTLSRPTVPQTIRWSTSFGLSYFYDTGLTTGKARPDGSIERIASTGMQARWGISGRHLWKRDQIGLDYAGSQNRYTSAAGLSGGNHSLSLDYSHILSRHLIFNLVENASSTSQSYGLQNQVLTGDASIANISLAASPTIDALDLSVRQFSSTSSVTWQKTARTSFNFSGGVFFVQRGTAGSNGVTAYQGDGSLNGVTGYQSGADYNYRLTRKMTVGSYYSFTNYVFSKNVAVSNSHTGGGIFSYAFDRRTQLRLRAGMAAVENKALTVVPLDPLIALLLARPTGIVSSYRRTLVQDISAQFVRDLGHRRTMNFAYARGLSPGNGITLASTRESASAALGMTVYRNKGIGFNAGVDRLEAVSASLVGPPSTYSSRYMQASFSQPHAHGLVSNYTLDYRLQNLSNGLRPFTQIRFSAGISFQPGEGKLW